MTCTNVLTAMLGGTFDPIHKGHLFLLDTAIRNTEYRHFILVPARLSNFKQNALPSASDVQRLEMVKLALEDFKELYHCPKNVSIEVSDIEISRGGVSYTSDTVSQLKQKLGITSRLGLVMGDDLIHGLTRWHDFDFLKEQVEFIICRRETQSCWEDLPKGLAVKQIHGDGLSPESSSSFREDPSKMTSLLTPRVAEYIKRNNLYV